MKGIIGGFFLVILLVVTAVWAVAEEEGFVLVTNANNQMASISRSEVERIFLSKKRIWPDGTNIAVVVNESPEVHRSFCAAVLRRNPHQFLFFQKKMLFRGQGIPPHRVKTDKEVLDFVSSRRGGLGYVSPGSVTPVVKYLPIVQ